MDYNIGADGDAASIVFAAIGVVISSLHIAAWNWDFPSYTIRILWRVLSVTATCCFPLLYSAVVSPGLLMTPWKVLAIIGIDKLPNNYFFDLLISDLAIRIRSISQTLKTIGIDEEKSFFTQLLFSLAIYIISRLGLIFLVFYCFSSMPASVYETVNWNTIFPHFS